MSTLAPTRPPSGPPPAPSAAAAPGWRSRLPWRRPEARVARLDDLATLCLSLLSIAVALSLGRLFHGTGWLAYAVAAAGLGHLLAWGLRRLGAGLAATAIASPLLSLLVAVELVVPQATTFGLPTPFTFQVMGQALTDAQGAFRTAVPPVAPAPGFLAAAVVGLCMCAFLADWAAFRMRRSFEACVPTLGFFVFAAVLGARSRQGAPAAALAGAALLFLIVQRANLEGNETPWFGGREQGALPSLLSAGAVLGTVAVVAGLVLGPRVPGATSKALVTFNKGSGGSGSGSRSTISPLVDIRTRLREYANVDVFTVESPRPAYWRLTSLDQFDGTIWSSNERYASSRGDLERAKGDRPRLVQQVQVAALSSIWLPAAYRPTKVDGVAGLSYSPGSDSLISKKDTSDGLRYAITSEVADLTPGELRQAPASEPGASGLGVDLGRYTNVGGPTSARVRQKAMQLSQGGATPYDKALAVQDYLRSSEFTYSLDAPAGHSGSAVDQFLFRSKKGYCEQFAGTYALLARLMGLPTRVAVGFQPGRKQDGVFTVKDSDAHAWPEVYLEGTGWTAFEPTPGRGNPQAQGYTGVPYIPAAPSGGDQSAPVTAPPVPGPGETAPTTAPPPQPPPAETPPPAGHANPMAGALSLLRRAAPVLAALGLIAGIVFGSAAFVAWERRRRRELGGGSSEGRVHMAWEEAVQALALAGVRTRAGETVDELLERLSRPDGAAEGAGLGPGTGANQALRRLGAAVVQTAYTGRSATGGLADAAEAEATTVVLACRSSVGRWDRWRTDLDPRPALARLRADQSRAAATDVISPHRS